MIEYLTTSLDLEPEDVYVFDGPLHIQDLMSLYDIDRPDLKDEPFWPSVLEWYTDHDNIFDAIQERDRLLHHPYDSYECVTGFINQAVDDPDVVAIKICLYRTGPESPIPPALIRASEQGKQVTALIELKARFDEEHNIEWARKLDEAGVHVVYGILGLKTHGKLTLVVRREGDTLRRYVHIAPVTTTQPLRAPTPTWACLLSMLRSDETPLSCSTFSPASRSRQTMKP